MRCAEGWEPRPASSCEFVWVAVDAEDENGAAMDPTIFDAFMLFQLESTLTSPSAGSAEWKPAEWRTLTVDRHGNTLPEPEYQMGVLVGEGGTIDPGVGHFDGYTKVVATQESPIRQVLGATLILT